MIFKRHFVKLLLFPFLLGEKKASKLEDPCSQVVYFGDCVPDPVGYSLFFRSDVWHYTG